MDKLPKKIQCIGSKTPGIKNHNLVHIRSIDGNYICDLKECVVLYFDFSHQKWYYKPGFKNEALKTSKE